MSYKRKELKIFLILLIFSVLTLLATAIISMNKVKGMTDKDFLKANGKDLCRDYGKGSIVNLRGTNVGGWLIQEFWMTRTQATKNVKDQSGILTILTERFGKDTMEDLVDTYQANYFSENDFDNCALLGMNCLRLPFWYRDIVDENGKILDDWYRIFDWFIQNASKRGIYVILDMHGAPGSQNGSDHSGKDGGDDKMGASEFFFGENAEANQELYYKIWETIAERYKGNPAVAGYDLLNEPYCTYRYSSGLSDEQLHELLWEIYDKAYRRIRSIDPDHVIIMEATWDPVDLPDPKIYGWENIMYEYHNYLYDDYDNANGQQIASMRKKVMAIAKADYDVPSYMGEFNYFNNADAWDEGLKLLTDAGINWTTWTYKVKSTYQNWGLYNYSSGSINLETVSKERIKEFYSQAGECYANDKLIPVISKYFTKDTVANKLYPGYSGR